MITKRNISNQIILLLRITHTAVHKMTFISALSCYIRYTRLFFSFPNEKLEQQWNILKQNSTIIPNMHSIVTQQMMFLICEKTIRNERDKLSEPLVSCVFLWFPGGEVGASHPQPDQAHREPLPGLLLPRLRHHPAQRVPQPQVKLTLLLLP